MRVGSDGRTTRLCRAQVRAERGSARCQRAATTTRTDLHGHEVPLCWQHARLWNYGLGRFMLGRMREDSK
jgi:hypothetical protein